MRDNWVETTLGQYIHINTGKLDVNAASKFGEYPFFTCSRETYRIDEAAFEGESVLVAGNGDLNVKYYDGKFNAYQRTYVLNSVDKKTLDNRFLFLYMQTYVEYLRSETRGTVIQYLKKGQFTNAKIKLPPMPEQKRIVDLISSVDSYIEALQQQLESAKRSRNALLHKIFHIDGSNWKLKKLVDCTQKISDGSHNPPKGIGESDFLMLSSKDIWDGYLTNLDPRFLQQSDFELENKRTQLEIGDVLLTVVGTIGRCAVYRGYPKNVTFQRSVCVIKTSKDVLNESFLMLYLQSIQSFLDQNARGVAQRGIYLNQIRDLEIPIPSLNEQFEVVSNIDVFDTFIQETQKVVAQTQKFRVAILSDLLSGTHEIPASYDKVIGAA